MQGPALSVAWFSPMAPNFWELPRRGQATRRRQLDPRPQHHSRFFTHLPVSNSGRFLDVYGSGPAKCPRHGPPLAAWSRWSRSLSEPGKQAPVRPSVRRWVARASSQWTSARSSTRGHSTSCPAPRCPSGSPSGPTGHSTSISGRRRHHGSCSTRPRHRRGRRTRGKARATRARRPWAPSASSTSTKSPRSSSPSCGFPACPSRVSARPSSTRRSQ